MKRICITCLIEKPLQREYFPRTGSTGVDTFTKECRDCKEKRLINKHWKDGKLLCCICEEYLDINNFGGDSNKEHRQGKESVCRECKTKEAARRRENLKGSQAVDRVITERFLAARLRASKYNLPFELTKEEIENKLIEQEYKCAISGIRMTFELGKGRVPTNMSIDKIIASKHYTIDNIQLVCMAVNQMKSDMSLEELLYFCKLILDTNECRN